ncbi:uncharacterized protein LOC121432072 [Lytechinus variegatus]|uniref:uncharacterized protein LOC121432072 n=1 Tax=Lytechinus variegatus TaxID=7654 RepID=UPI001BB12588|nr:uncharacterized protein LOC121432072 [Lytechinus variegatus]
MSLFGTLELRQNRRKRKKYVSDPGPATISSFISRRSRVFGPLLERPDGFQAAPSSLEPDTLEVKRLPQEQICSSRELPKMASRRRKLSKKLQKILSSPFGLFLLLVVYMVLGALMFIYVESGTARELDAKLKNERFEHAQILVLNGSCYQDAECVTTWLKQWEEKLWEFPMGIIDHYLTLWSFENSFHLCFSIVTTIGYGNITPVTNLGRMLVIVYAIFGIPIMLLFVSDVGTVIAEKVKGFVLLYRSKRRATIEARRSRKKQKETKSKGTASAQVSVSKSSLDGKEQLAMTSRTNHEFLEEGSPQEEIMIINHLETSGGNSNDRNSQTKFEMDHRKKGKNGIHVENKDDTLNDVNAKKKHLANKVSERRIPVIMFDPDSGDESDIEEIIGEVIEDDVDLYDTAEIVVDESDSEDYIVINGLISSTHHRWKENRKEDRVFASSEAIVETKDRAKYSRSQSDSVIETLQIEETYSSHRNCLDNNKESGSLNNHNGNIGGRRISRTPDGHTLIELNTPDTTNNKSRVVSDPSSDKTQRDIKSKDNQQKEGEQKPTSNGGFKSSENNHRPLSFRGAVPSPGNNESDINDVSFPWWMAFLLLFLYLVIGMFMFHYAIEWSHLDSFYYAFVSLSTIGFGDLYYQPSSVRGSIYYTFIYCFVGFCYTSMCMSLSSRELLRVARRVAWKIGYYRSRRWKTGFRAFWKARRMRDPRHAGRWTLRRRKPLRIQRIDESPGTFP